MLTWVDLHTGCEVYTVSFWGRPLSYVIDKYKVIAFDEDGLTVVDTDPNYDDEVVKFDYDHIVSTTFLGACESALKRLNKEFSSDADYVEVKHDLATTIQKLRNIEKLEAKI